MGVYYEKRYGQYMIVSHLSCFGERSVVVITCDVGNISRGTLHSECSENVGTVHVPKVGAAMEHVEVDASICCKDVSKDFTEVRF